MQIPKVDDLVAGRQLIAYGCGAALLTTLQTSGMEPSFVVSDLAEARDDTVGGYPIKAPEALAALGPDESFIVVCAYKPDSIRNIGTRLEAMGRRYLEHWVDCSLYHYQTIGARLETAFGIQADPMLFARTRSLVLQALPRNQTGISGTWLFEELLRDVCARVRGSIAELGVYQGGNALVTLLQLGDVLRDRSYHLFDTFAGFPGITSEDPASRAGDFADSSLPEVRFTFGDYPTTRLHVGPFSETLREVENEQFAMVYIDCDLYEPALECLDFFYDRMSSGAMILFHDYYDGELALPKGVTAAFEGIAKAVREFFVDRPEEPVAFPESLHALVVKA